MSDFNRREFLRKSAVGASAFAMGVGARPGRAASPNEKAEIGIIGVGGRGSHLLRRVSRQENVHIRAICDLVPKKVDAAKEFKEIEGMKPMGYTNFREMLDKEKLDGVIVATEVGNHAKVVVPVLEAGFNVFSEKPIDTTVERVDAVVKAARKAKGILQVGFQRRYNVGYVEAIKRVHQGDLGPVLFLQGAWQWTWAVGPGGWVVDMDLGGGELVEQAGHHMDVMSWVMKNQAPLECVAMAGRLVPSPQDKPTSSEDHSAIAFRFPGDVIFSYTHLFYCPEPFQLEKMWVYGKGWGVDLVKSELYQGGESKPIAEGSGTDWDKGTDNELEAFVKNVGSGKPVKPISNVETARVATLMALMGRQAFRDVKSGKYESNVVRWKDLGTTTDPA
jgi:predicted dehydrogenase